MDKTESHYSGNRLVRRALALCCLIFVNLTGFTQHFLDTLSFQLPLNPSDTVIPVVENEEKWDEERSALVQHSQYEWLSTKMRDLGEWRVALRLWRRQHKLSTDQGLKNQHVRFHRVCGSIFFEAAQFDSAYQHYSLAIQAIDTVKEGSSGMAHILNDRGMASYFMGKPAKAEDDFMKSTNIILSNIPVDSNFLGSIRDNRGLVLLDAGKPLEAYRLFNNNHLFFNEWKHDRLLQTKIRVAVCLIRMGEFVEAENRIVEVLSEYRILASRERIHILKIALEAYRELALEKEDQELVLQVLEAQIRLDSTIERYHNHVQGEIGMLIDEVLVKQWESLLERNDAVVQKHRASQALLKEKESVFRQRILIYGLLIMVFVVGLVVNFRFRNRRLKTRAKMADLNEKAAQLELENQRLTSEKLSRDLEGKKQDLVNATLEISRRQKWLEDLEAKLSNTDPNQNLKMVFQELRMQIQSDDKKDNFFRHLEEVNHSFYAGLRAVYPKITNTELELCALLRLKISTKEIASYRNITIDSVRKARKRLRKTLGLKPEQDIIEFLEKFGDNL